MKEAVNRVLSDRKGERFKLSWQTLDVLEATKRALEPLAPLTDALSGESEYLKKVVVVDYSI